MSIIKKNQYWIKNEKSKHAPRRGLKIAFSSALHLWQLMSLWLCYVWIGRRVSRCKCGIKWATSLFLEGLNFRVNYCFVSSIMTRVVRTLNSSTIILFSSTALLQVSSVGTVLKGIRFVLYIQCQVIGLWFNMVKWTIYLVWPLFWENVCNSISWVY